MKLLSALLATLIANFAFADQIQFHGSEESYIRYKITSFYDDPTYYTLTVIDLMDSAGNKVFSVMSGFTIHRYIYLKSSTADVGVNPRFDLSDGDADVMVDYARSASPTCPLEIVVEKKTGKITEVTSPCM